MPNKTPFKRFQVFLERHPLTFILITIGTLLGFISGAIDSIQTISDVARPKPHYFNASTENPIRLNANSVLELIVDNSETGRVVEPSDESIEGRPKTWYRARYFADGTMVYDHADHRVSEEQWDWYIDNDGNLCRGPQWADFRSCRTIISVGENQYQATGLRTGTLRYTFSMEDVRVFDIRSVAILILSLGLLITLCALLWMRFSRVDES